MARNTTNQFINAYVNFVAEGVDVENDVRRVVLRQRDRRAGRVGAECISRRSRAAIYLCVAGRRADLVLTSDLVTLPIEMVIARGRVLAEHGRLTAEISAFAYPASAKNTVNMKRDLTAADFAIAAPKGANEVTATVELKDGTKQEIVADRAVTDEMINSTPRKPRLTRLSRNVRQCTSCSFMETETPST